MPLRKAEFIGSFPKLSLAPDTGKPEYAFIGRSNVGKSSLLNALANQKNLAKTSSRPGKTQMLNYFLMDDGWYLVDLPGYGFAKVSKPMREKLQKLIHTYVAKRTSLIQLFVLLDCRHEPQRIDLEFMEWLGENGIPFAMVFTKADKISKVQWQKNFAVYRKAMLKTWESLPPVFLTSSETGQGAEELLEYIEATNQRLAELP
ncbi:MAG: ribosome biogenesis GTP-binding protein YihA/YsxC [Bacteroidota bacterium]|nr:ribosome biogenesis GTP-binding protein YihA/YsxC [Bacteroidota bacterium]MDX5429108.1 ribosome biogenesis GTP-binding protein YihA/YsxC [Bacteroidota bacterium]MDX5448823.1 ribosome biogenesis GTP-binding protein YihA/YsxC [Bacteroidota bacterium]MDX5506757.1 ribosome biogenesis GTP-binding protein YihA/YsxC [Bacteroidota bacterium]